MEAILVSDNGFTKIFKLGDIDLIASKAIDEDTDKHFIINSIPFIPELGVGRIQQPFIYDTAKDRDAAFDTLDTAVAEGFIYNLIEFIKEQNEKNKEDEKAKKDSPELNN